MAWAQGHLEEFERRAEAGNEGMRELVESVKGGMGEGGGESLSFLGGHILKGWDLSECNGKNQVRGLRKARADMGIDLYQFVTGSLCQEDDVWSTPVLGRTSFPAPVGAAFTTTYHGKPLLS